MGWTGGGNLGHFLLLCNMMDFKPLGENRLSNIPEQRDRAATWVVSATTLLIGEIREGLTAYSLYLPIQFPTSLPVAFLLGVSDREQHPKGRRGSPGGSAAPIRPPELTQHSNCCLHLVKINRLYTQINF